MPGKNWPCWESLSRKVATALVYVLWLPGGAGDSRALSMRRFSRLASMCGERRPGTGTGCVRNPREILAEPGFRWGADENSARSLLEKQTDGMELYVVDMFGALGAFTDSSQ